MTAPQVIATIFFLVSAGSATALAVMAAASAVLDAVAEACDRPRPDAGRDRARRVSPAPRQPRTPVPPAARRSRGTVRPRPLRRGAAPVRRRC